MAGAMCALEVPEKNIQTQLLIFGLLFFDYLDTTDRVSSLPMALFHQVGLLSRPGDGLESRYASCGQILGGLY